MATINYQFADGHREDIEVTEAFALQYELIDNVFTRNENRAIKRNKRNHVSLETNLAKGWDKAYADADDPLEILIDNECDELSMLNLADFLTPRQKQVMELYYEVGYRKAEIARLLNLTKPTIEQHISESVKKILKNF